MRLEFVAGSAQSGLKLVFVRRRSLTEAFGVDTGFGLTEAFAVGDLRLRVSDRCSSSTPPGLFAAAEPVAALERFTVALFHAGSIVLLADFSRGGRGLVGFVLIASAHGLRGLDRGRVSADEPILSTRRGRSGDPRGESEPVPSRLQESRERGARGGAPVVRERMERYRRDPSPHLRGGASSPRKREL